MKKDFEIQTLKDNLSGLDYIEYRNTETFGNNTPSNTTDEITSWFKNNIPGWFLLLVLGILILKK